MIGASDDATMRGFVLIVALLLDPAAVLLLLAATHRPAPMSPAARRRAGFFESDLT